MSLPEFQKLHKDLLGVLDERNKWADQACEQLKLGIFTEKGAADHIARGANSGNWRARVEAATAAAEQLVQRTTAARDGMIEKLRRPPTTSTNEALLQESQIARAWARAQQHLEAAPNPAARMATVHRLVKDADETTLAALLQELPDYLTVRGVDPGTVDRALRDGRPELVEADQRIVTASNAGGIIKNNASAIGGTLDHYRDLHPTYTRTVFDPEIAYRDRNRDANGAIVSNAVDASLAGV